MNQQKKTKRVSTNLSTEQYMLIKKKQESSTAPNLSQFIRYVLFPKDDKIAYRNLDEENILKNLNKLSIQLFQLKKHLDHSITILEGQLKKIDNNTEENISRLIDSIRETNKLLLELNELFNKIILVWSQNTTKPAIL